MECFRCFSIWYLSLDCGWEFRFYIFNIFLFYLSLKEDVVVSKVFVFRFFWFGFLLLGCVWFFFKWCLEFFLGKFGFFGLCVRI